MFKKIIIPKNEVEYRQDCIDNKYLINEGNRAIGLFAITKEQTIPTQISPQDVLFYSLEGVLEINFDDKSFVLEKDNMILIPKTSAYTLKVLENTKILTVRL